ncbi:MAG: SusC/RagA family TonB-linked outer membrane protein, partial [Bacteroidales bacterium]|nr:SusC/RagA family TonB-linked outer membrane protein [Bacteroidales bacterium]
MKGTKTGVVTDANGKFSINAASTDVLQVSSVGYTTQDIEVGDQTSFEVNLSEGEQLGEVVVTALGISREAKSLGYAMTTISAKELTKTGSSNFATALYGKSAGVRIQNTQGGAAGGVSINVRGLSSINGNTQPLVIMNGVPIRNGNATTGGSATSDNISGRDFASIGNGVRSNGLVDINPEDIESLSILKGAAATALYGSEAANGAIIITSKKAKGKGVSVDANVIMQANFLAQLPPIQAKYGPGNGYSSWSGDMLDNEGFHVTADGKLYPHYNASNNQQWGPAYDGRQVQYVNGQPRPYSAFSSEPWTELFRTGFNQVYNIAVSQGSDNANNRFSYTYTDETPNALSGTYNKHNFNLVGNVKFNEKLSVDYTGNYVVQHFGHRSGTDLDSYNFFGSTWGSFVDVPLIRTLYKNPMGYLNSDDGNKYYDADAPHRFQYDSNGFVDGVRGKFWGLFEDDSDELEHRLIASVAPTYKITGWLTAKGRIATDYTTNSQETFTRSSRPAAGFPNAGDQTGGYSTLHKTYQINYGDVMLMFDKKLTDNFQLTVNAGWQAREENMKSSNIGTNAGLAMDNVFQITNSYKSVSTDANTYRKMSLLKTAWVGTIGAGYHDFLFADVTGRWEKSSTLPAGSRDFFYPSASASFLYSEAFSLPQWYNYGKVRISYGIVGNAPEAYAANMAYDAKSDAGGFVYNQVPSSLGNDKLKPETTNEFEIGLESKFFNNRLGFEVSYYNRKISDMLIQVPLAPSSGSSNLWVNSGVMTNAGFEFSINGTPVKTTDFEWVIRANGGFNDNHIESLAEGIPFIQHGGVGSSNAADTRSYAGRSMGDYYSNPFLVVESGPYAGQRIVAASGEYRTGDREPIANAMP